MPEKVSLIYAILNNSANWVSSAPSVGTVTATGGLAKGIATGKATITATSGTISGSSTLIVTAAAIVTITVTPNPFATGVGISRQMNAVANYSDGTVVDVTSSAAWTSSTPTVATVTGGLVKGVALGSTTVSAMVGSVVGSAALSVTVNGWNPAASMSVARLFHTATLLQNGTVLVSGGQGATGAAILSSAESYNPSDDTWTTASNMNVQRSGHTATLLQNGKVLVVGGGGDGVFNSSAEIYDPVANTWTLVASMSIARYGHTASLLTSGKVLVAGGTNSNSTAMSAEIYDPVANTWAPAAAMSFNQTTASAQTLANGHILIAGGYTGTLPPAVSPNAEIYDPVANTWSLTPNLPNSAFWAVEALLPSGSVLLAGGSQTEIEAVPYTNIYDPVANAWTAGPSMQLGVYFETATVLPSGNVLFAGGFTYPTGGQTAVNFVEIYDSVANSWNDPIPHMIAARAGHTATLLPSGAILVAGGNPGPQNSCELYW